MANIDTTAYIAPDSRWLDDAHSHSNTPDFFHSAVGTPYRLRKHCLDLAVERANTEASGITTTKAFDAAEDDAPILRGTCAAAKELDRQTIHDRLHDPHYKRNTDRPSIRPSSPTFSPTPNSSVTRVLGRAR